jgi:hypothetical protein
MQPSSPQSPRNRRTEFDAQAEERYAKVIASGLTISWHDMREYLEARMAGKATKRPIARRTSRAEPI